MSNKRITAAEALAKLEADPEYRARRERLDVEWERRDRRLREAEQPLVADLRAAGFSVASVWDLVNASAPYPEALPILLRHLDSAYPAAIREGIARALAVAPAAFACATLIRHFRDEKEKRTRDGLAVAIANACAERGFDEIVALVEDRTFGPSRILLLSALERSSNPAAIGVLQGLRDDPDLCVEVRLILRRLGRPQN